MQCPGHMAISKQPISSGAKLTRAYLAGGDRQELYSLSRGGISDIATE